MTCIVGIVQDGKVYIGGDSAGVAGLDLVVRADRKVFKNGEFIMGFTSSFRMGQLLAYAFTPPVRRIDQDVYAYMVTDFVSSVRDCLKAGGFAQKSNDAESGGTFLVGYAGRLFMVADDYQVAESADGFAACGCGAQVALGALFAGSAADPKEKVLNALHAAERFSAGVRRPFIAMEL
jgi:ATP-dependent protease HslVU (ClpYQ) peptidase subunit